MAQVFYADDQAKDDLEIPKRWTEDAMKAHEMILDILEKEGL